MRYGPDADEHDEVLDAIATKLGASSSAEATAFFNATMSRRFSFSADSVQDKYDIDLHEVLSAPVYTSLYTTCPEKRCHFIFACNSAKC